MKRALFTSIAILVFLLAGTAFAIFYAKGYRISPGNKQKTVEGTGLLVATSKPDGAKVLIQNHLKTATNNTINLAPGDYEITIEKDGYFPWKKRITIKKEEVTRADALLFPTAPKLENITTTGAANPVIDPSGTLITYTVSSSSAQRNGIYIINMNANPILGIGGPITQIANDLTFPFSKAQLEFSADGRQVLASISANFGVNSYLLSAKDLNNYKNITTLLAQTKRDWAQEKQSNLDKLVNNQTEELAQIIQSSFTNISFSPDRDKILYEASSSATLPIIIKPRLIGTNSTAEDRDIKQGNTYVYDIKEDRNYALFDASTFTTGETLPFFIWHPYSKNLIFTKERKIYIIDFDGQNKTVVYAGPFVDNFVFAWPDGGSLVILTNLNSEDAPYNLYRLSLR